MIIVPEPGDAGAWTDGVAFLFPLDRATWRTWLEANHATEPRVWVVLTKKGSGLAGIGAAEAAEEALCFGWIDSRPGKIDAARWMLQFTPRRPGSVWSKINKDRPGRTGRHRAGEARPLLVRARFVRCPGVADRPRPGARTRFGLRRRLGALAAIHPQAAPVLDFRRPARPHPRRPHRPHRARSEGGPQPARTASQSRRWRTFDFGLMLWHRPRRLSHH